MQVRPRHFEFFNAVAALGSVTTAARSMAVSQPAVSRYLRELESEIGVPLRYRQGNTWQLTAEGRLLYEQITREMRGFERTLRFAQDLRSARKGFLAIGCIPLLSVRLVPDLLASYLESHPQVSASVVSQHSSAVVEMVRLGQSEIGFGLDTPNHPDVASEPIASLQVLCVVPRKHALARKRRLTLSDLDAQSIVTLGTQDTVQSEIDRVLSGHGIVPSRRVEATMAQVVMELARRGVGIGIVDSYSADLFGSPDLVALRLAPALTYTLSLITRRGASLSAAAATFVEHAKARPWAVAGGLVRVESTR